MEFIDIQELPFLISVDLLYPDNSSKRVPERKIMVMSKDGFHS